MEPTPHNYNPTADHIIGVLLSLCSVSGLLFNTPSLYYFLRKPALNSNSRYFARIYTLISTVDLLTSLTLFPFVDAAVSAGRKVKLFLPHGDLSEQLVPGPYRLHVGVCEIWAVLWKVLPEVAVFLVAFLSVSRFLLLRSPTRTFVPLLAWLVPLGYGVCTVVFKVVLLLTGVTRVVYKESTMSCELLVNLSEKEGEPIKEEEWRWEVVLRALSYVQSGMTVLPISLSCLFSVILLLRAERNADKVHREKRRRLRVSKQRGASLTVILITLIYIVFNVPTLMYYIYLARWSSSIQLSGNNITRGDVGQSHSRYFSTDFERLYMWVVFATVLTACNSVVNPLIYYLRMKGFRDFVKRNFKEKTGLIKQSVDLVFSNNYGGSADFTEDKDLETTV